MGVSLQAPWEGYIKARASARMHPWKVTSKHGRQPASTLGRLRQSTGVSPQAPWEGLEGPEGLSDLEGLTGIEDISSLEGLSGLEGLLSLECIEVLSGYLSGLEGFKG